MGIPLRVLIVEDVEDDAELLVQEIRRKGYDPLYERVDTEKAMQDALDRQTWDIVICDYSMPGFNAISAMELKRKNQNDLPLILVSGTIGEEVAVEAMKAGADDYVMKNNLTRIVPAIERELEEYEERRHLQQVENAIQALVKSIVGTTGQDFFDRIVRSLSEWLGTDCATLCAVEGGDKLKSLSTLSNGKLSCHCTCALQGTVCEAIMKEGYKSYPNGLTESVITNCEFLEKMEAVGYVGTAISNKDGKDIGIFWTVSRNKLNLPPRTKEVMEIIAAKAGAEIERLKAEEDLQQSEQHHRKLLNSLKEGIYQSELHVDGVFTWVNQAFAEIFGYKSPEEMIGTKVKDIYVDTEDRRRLLEKLVKDEVWKNFESLCKKKNGEHIYTERTSTMNRDEKGNPYCVEGVMRDITERKQMEEKLRMSEERFRELAENIPEVFWVTSPDFKRMIYISPAYETIWGRTCKSLYEHPESWMDNIHPDDRDRVAAALENHVNGKDGFAEEYRVMRTDGSQRWIVDCAYSIKGESGLTDHIIGVAKDITERKIAEEKIKTSLHEKEVLLKEIHHRVKNNMQIVSSLLNLQSESVDDESIRQLLKKSQNRVKSMALVHEKLYQTEDLSSIDFAEYTRSLTTRLLHSFGSNSKRVQLVIDMDEVCLDVNRAIPCGLIINEIVTNSFKHAFPDSTTGVDENKFEGKGVIKVFMRENPKSGIMELVVGDNGMGLPEGLDFRHTKTLGMELVNTLVDQLDGSIEYVNNGGTEFKITFKV